MPKPTYRGSVIAHYILDLLRDNMESFEPQAFKVLYGDQVNIPEGRTVCVEPAQTVRTPGGAPMMMDNENRVVVIVYSTHIDGSEAAQKNGDLLVDDIADYLNLQSQPGSLYASGNLMDGLITAGWVESIDRGYAKKNDRLMRANRLTWVGSSHTHLVLDAEGNKHA
jgi:hypothetical protein